MTPGPWRQNLLLTGFPGLPARNPQVTQTRASASGSGLMNPFRDVLSGSSVRSSCTLDGTVMRSRWGFARLSVTPGVGDTAPSEKKPPEELCSQQALG